MSMHSFLILRGSPPQVVRETEAKAVAEPDRNRSGLLSTTKILQFPKTNAWIRRMNPHPSVPALIEVDWTVVFDRLVCLVLADGGSSSFPSDGIRNSSSRRGPSGLRYLFY